MKVPVAAGGKQIACPRCKQAMVLPGAVPAAPPVPPPVPPPAQYAPQHVAQQFAPPPPPPPPMAPASDNPFALDDPAPGGYAPGGYAPGGYGDEGPMVSAPSMGRRPSGSGGGVALGLGIGSLVVGVIAVVMVVALSCLAWLAIPIGVLGLLLGIAGLIVAIVAGRGYLFPILGMSICAGAMVLAYFWPYIVVRSAVRDLDDKLRHLEKGVPPPGFEKIFDPKKAPPFEFR